MSWIGTISTGFSLVAFLAWCIVLVVQRRQRTTEKIITSASEEGRNRAIEAVLEVAHVDTTGLSPEHKFRYAQEVLFERRRRMRIQLVVLGLFLLMATVIALASLQRPPPTPVPAPPVEPAVRLAVPGGRELLLQPPDDAEVEAARILDALTTVIAGAGDCRDLAPNVLAFLRENGPRLTTLGQRAARMSAARRQQWQQALAPRMVALEELTAPRLASCSEDDLAQLEQAFRPLDGAFPVDGM